MKNVCLRYEGPWGRDCVSGVRPCLALSRNLSELIVHFDGGQNPYRTAVRAGYAPPRNLKPFPRFFGPRRARIINIARQTCPPQLALSPCAASASIPPSLAQIRLCRRAKLQYDEVNCDVNAIKVRSHGRAYLSILLMLQMCYLQ